MEHAQHAQSRSCGACSLCCKIPLIEELSKPRGQWCVNFVRGTGCGIYETRPQTCRGFMCQWLLDPAMPPEWDPKKSRMYMATEGDRKLIVHVDAGSPGPWGPAHYPWLKKTAAHALSQGMMVLVIAAGQTSVVLPDRRVDLGAVSDKDVIKISEFGQGAAKRYDVEVARGAA